MPRYVVAVGRKKEREELLSQSLLDEKKCCIAEPGPFGSFGWFNTQLSHFACFLYMLLYTYIILYLVCIVVGITFFLPAGTHTHARIIWHALVCHMFATHGRSPYADSRTHAIDTGLTSMRRCPRVGISGAWHGRDVTAVLPSGHFTFLLWQMGKKSRCIGIGDFWCTCHKSCFW